MSRRVFAYSRSNAEIRGLISRLITPDQLRLLAAAQSLEGAFRMLLSTAYGDRITRILESGPTLEAAERMLESSLIDSYKRIIPMFAGDAGRLLERMVQRLEVENLKTILRGVSRGEPQDAVLSLLWPLGSLSQLPFSELLAQPDVESILTILSDTEYGPVLRDALSRFTVERSLFPLEVALDVFYYRRLWKAVEALSNLDRSLAGRMMAIRFDLLNIAWIVRYRLIYNLAPEEIYNYTLPYGRLIDGEVVRRAASAEGIDGISSALPEPYRSLLAGLTGTSGAIERLELALNRYLLSIARSVLAGYPFHLAVSVSYLWLREAEVHDLRVVFEGKSHNLSSDSILSNIWGAF